jgi:UDP:flavonoid glycosyltransferase YjiC (YdhE family)
MSGGFESFANVKDIPFIARHATKSREEVVKALKLPADKPIVLVSFGGYGLSGLDTDQLAKFKKYTVVNTNTQPLGRTRKEAATTERKGSYISINEEAMYDTGVRYEDLVGAAEAVVTKPGYGIVSECIANETAMLYTFRGHFVEQDVLVQGMSQVLRCRAIEPSELRAGRWQAALDALLQQETPGQKMAIDGASVVADSIVTLATAVAAS